MAKRNLEDFEEDITENKRFLHDLQGDRKHTLDSDESDNEEDPHMHPDDIEGEEAGDERVDAEEEIKFTPFNMNEELEDGHFDQMGHYHFKKDERNLDNWLDDVDWVKIKKDEDYRRKYNPAATADVESSSDDEEGGLPSGSGLPKTFDSHTSFSEILSHMQPGETINKALQRLNKSKMNVSTAQRWKLKKQGIVDEASEKITKVTGLVNEILTKTGNMNVYELTYEQVQLKVRSSKNQAGSSKEPELDMYADDYDEKLKSQVHKTEDTLKEEEEDFRVMWEWKRTQDENEAIQGPFTTEQMLKKVENGDFKENVFVRKIGDERFYSSARVDFDLYL